MKKVNPCLLGYSSGKRVTMSIGVNCPLKCKHCYQNGQSRQVQDSDLNIKILKQMGALPVTKLYFDGAEPFTSKELDTYLDVIQEQKQEFPGSFRLVSIGTSGIIHDSKRAELLYNKGLTNIMVSLDGSTSKTHDEFRRKGSFEAAKRCISDLCSIGYDVRIGTTIWSKNVEELEEIANLAESLGAKEVAYNWLQPSGNALKNPEILLDNKSFPEISRRLNSLDVSIKTSFHRAGYSDEESICQAGRDIFYIAGDRIWPCSWVRVADANFGSQLSLREHTLQYILENDRNLKAFRNIAEKAKGSCPSMAKIYTDNLLGLDPIQEGGIHR